jgi:hypothetical protein
MLLVFLLDRPRRELIEAAAASPNADPARDEGSTRSRLGESERGSRGSSRGRPSRSSSSCFWSREVERRGESSPDASADPIGYLNVRQRVLGRDIRTVEIDDDRAPFVKLAFESYASGGHSVGGIAEMLDGVGPETVMTAERAPVPLTRAGDHKVLKDDYYAGIVTLNGVKVEGEHPALIDVEAFDRVQRRLDGHRLSGDRSHKHDRYLI